MNYQSFSVYRISDNIYFKYDLYEIFSCLSNIVTNGFLGAFKMIVCDNKKDYELYHLLVMRLNDDMRIICI